MLRRGSNCCRSFTMNSGNWPPSGRRTSPAPEPFSPRRWCMRPGSGSPDLIRGRVIFDAGVMGAGSQRSKGRWVRCGPPSGFMVRSPFASRSSNFGVRVEGFTKVFPHLPRCHLAAGALLGLVIAIWSTTRIDQFFTSSAVRRFFTSQSFQPMFLCQLFRACCMSVYFKAPTDK